MSFLLATDDSGMLNSALCEEKFKAQALSFFVFKRKDKKLKRSLRCECKKWTQYVVKGLTSSATTFWSAGLNFQDHVPGSGSAFESCCVIVRCLLIV